MFRHILIPTDGSALSAIAVDKTLAFAKDAGAKVTILTVVEPFHVFSTHSEQLADTRASYEKHSKTHAAQRLADAKGKADALGIPCATVQSEHDQPYQAIIDAAKKAGCDLIAMASHGRRGMSALMLGSETTKVLTHSTIPVLVYR
jgi:nucleotide-binding universal stress UspA family protein